MPQSTYYYNLQRDFTTVGCSNNPKGREIPGYSHNLMGEKICDEQIKEWLIDLVAGDGFPYGYKKLTDCLQEDYFLQINHKKVYRLCKELDILRPQRELKKHRPRRLAKRFEIDGFNQLWEVDVKYGYIDGTDEFFFQLSIIDVFDRNVIDYHLGLSCKAEDASRTLKNAFIKRELTKEAHLPIIRTDNGPQFISKVFGDTCEGYGLQHQRIPVKTPNMNAHIEAFHSILEDECYSWNEFQCYPEVYEIVSGYMTYYNHRRRHGSLKNATPALYYQQLKHNLIKGVPFTA